MARKQPTKPDDAPAGDALAIHDDAATLAQLSDFFDTVGLDGLEDVGGEDVKLAALLWNMRGKGKDGRTLTKDVLFNTITEETAESVDVVFLLSRKTKRWDSFDNALDKTIVHCTSDDRVHGRMTDGTTRACHKCPDDGWHTSPEGKPMRKCGEVHNVVGIERLTQRPLMVRFKKTALKPWRQHLMAHHWGATVREIEGEKKRANVPLFCYATRVSLKMSDNGNYALPVFDRVPQGVDGQGEPTHLMPIDEIKAYGQHAKDFVEVMGEMMANADAQSSKHDTGGSESADNLPSEDFAD